MKFEAVGRPAGAARPALSAAIAADLLVGDCPDSAVLFSALDTGDQPLAVAGLLLGELIDGALITETIFGPKRLGQLTKQAVNNQDVAVLQAVVMISALGFVVINLLVDLLMPLLDPRLQLLRVVP